MAKREGFNIRVRVNGEPYRVRRVERDSTSADLEVGDSEDGRFETHIGGRRVARITLENATYDPADNPIGEPFFLEDGEIFELQIFWGGEDEDFDDFPEVLCLSNKHMADIPGLQPVTITAVSTGDYTLVGHVEV